MRDVIPNNDGRIFVKQITNPGAGAMVEIYPPQGERWLLMSVSCVFQTSVAVANRQVEWYVDEAVLGSVFYAGIFSTIQLAGLTRSYHFFTGQCQAPYDLLGIYMGGIPTGIRLVYGMGFIITAAGVQAADVFSGIYVIGQKWIDPEILV